MDSSKDLRNDSYSDVDSGVNVTCSECKLLVLLSFYLLSDLGYPSNRDKDDSMSIER